MSILQIINELKATSSRLGKEAILKREQNNLVLKKVFYEALDQMHNFYIGPQPVPGSAAYGTLSLDEHVLAPDGLLDKLRYRHLTGNEARWKVSSTLGLLTEDDADILNRILDRSLDCGVQASTVNKIWPNLVHEYPVLLAEKDEPKNRSRIKFPAYAEFKCDGMRVNVVVCAGQVVEYRARSGKYLEINQVDVDAAFVRMANGKSVVYDGELLAFDDSGKLLNRQTGNGIGNKAVRGTISMKEVKMLGFCVWDRIEREEFDARKGKTPYSQRIAALNDDLTRSNTKKIVLVERRLVNSWDEVGEWYASVVNDGGEGLLMKNKDHVWEDNRSRDLVKMKEVITGDFEVTGWNEGTGKFTGKLGALTIANKDRTIQCEVGGFTDDLRAQFSPGFIIGKIIEVEYNAIVEDKSRPGIKKLFLPRFKTLRLDKTVSE